MLLAFTVTLDEDFLLRLACQVGVGLYLVCSVLLARKAYRDKWTHPPDDIRTSVAWVIGLFWPVIIGCWLVSQPLRLLGSLVENGD